MLAPVIIEPSSPSLSVFDVDFVLNSVLTNAFSLVVAIVSYVTPNSSNFSSASN